MFPQMLVVELALFKALEIGVKYHSQAVPLILWTIPTQKAPLHDQVAPSNMMAKVE